MCMLKGDAHLVPKYVNNMSETCIVSSLLAHLIEGLYIYIDYVKLIYEALLITGLRVLPFDR